MPRQEDLSQHLPYEQFVEMELLQPELAREVHDVINGFKRGLKRTPQFVDAAVDQVLDFHHGYIGYDIGNSHYSVLIENKDHKEYDGRVEESFEFHKYTEATDGKDEVDWSMFSWSEYVNDKPTRARISVSGAPRNTASALREAREFQRSEFGDLQAQPKKPSPKIVFLKTLAIPHDF